MVIAAVCGLTISLSLATFITIQKKNSNEGDNLNKKTFYEQFKNEALKIKVLHTTV